jgi:hypothetical protein
MTEQTQARYPDHSDLLLNVSKLPWGTRTKKLPNSQGPPTMSRGPTLWQKSNFQGSIGDTAYPEEIGWFLISFPFSPQPSYLIPPTSSHKTLPSLLIPGEDTTRIAFRLTVQQGPLETPVTFLQWFKDAFKNIPTVYWSHRRKRVP